MKIKYLILHNSDSEWGDTLAIREWHKKRGWKREGYHYIVLNGYRDYATHKTKRLNKEEVGRIEKGRPDDMIGAHVLGLNSVSLGICMIGVRNFRIRQVWRTVWLFSRLLKKYNLNTNSIIGHYETKTGQDQGKTCPNYNMKKFRSLVRIVNYFS